MNLNEFFTGGWHYTRRMQSGAAAEGLARFSPKGEGLLYEESGTLTLPDGMAMQAEQTYLFIPEDKRLNVMFNEKPPRLFHLVEFYQTPAGHWQAEGRHLCGEDVYTTTYTLLGAGHFTIRHRIKGPKKNEDITTDYRAVV